MIIYPPDESVKFFLTCIRASTQRLPSLWAIHSMPSSSECTGRYTPRERSFCGFLSRLGPWFTCMTLSSNVPCQLSRCHRLPPWKFHRFLDIEKELCCCRQEGKHLHIKIIYAVLIIRIQLTDAYILITNIVRMARTCIITIFELNLMLNSIYRVIMFTILRFNC